MYLIDYHVHTKRCGHARGEDREYVEAAIRSGLREIGFADHVPRFYEADQPGAAIVNRGMSWADLEDYVTTVTGLRCAYPEIQIKLGLEVDYLPGWESRIAAIASRYPWDYLLGSVHFLPQWDYGYIGYDKTHAPREIYPAYFKQVAAAAGSKLFDVLAHIDLPRRFFKSLPEAEMAELYGELAVSLGKAAAVIELNTYAIRSAKQERVGVLPERDLLRLCRREGVRVTLGSDAHQPEEVGADFDTAVALLQETGYDGIIGFQHRDAQAVFWREKE